MKKLLSLSFALWMLALCPIAGAAWSPDWAHRAKITIDTAADGVATQAAVDGFPLLIRLHTGNFSFIDAKPDGTDLRFVASDDKTPLKFHIEKFDGLNELALVWVQLPKVAPGAKADFIWLYYGNPNATAGDDAKGTYDAAQALVYHFNEKDGPPQDTTANANHATRSSVTAGGTGLIGGGLTLDGKGSFALPATPSLKAAGASGLTLSMWLKPGALDQRAALFAPAGAGPSLAIEAGRLVARLGAQTVTAGEPLVASTWQHVALVVKDGLALYLNGREVGKVAGAAADVDAGGGVVGAGFVGDLDEFEVASTARSADWLKLAAGSQGEGQKLIAYGQAEGGSDEGGPSYIKILLGALTPDGWAVVGILAVMLVISVAVMVSKVLLVNTTRKANDRFKKQYQKMLEGIGTGPADEQAHNERVQRERRFRKASLYRLYAAGVDELQQRFDAYAKAGREPILSAQSINAIRATIDARFVRETQRLNAQMVLLTIAIAGGPFLGLLGTVVGVMITFAAIAAAGDVNVNAIAPGIAAALIATVAGLAVAIPSLFGYNYLASRIKDLSSDMQVFIDEFVTKIAENYSV
jgi:biopolymer transport protein ExbB